MTVPPEVRAALEDVEARDLVRVLPSRVLGVSTGYVSPYWAGRFLDRWCTRAMRSRLEPMKEVARMVRSHRDLILNWFRAPGAVLQRVVEGFNGKARVITKRAYGFRTSGALEVALYHALGDLPEPEFTHRLC